MLNPLSEEKVYFPNSRGTRLCGVLCNPSGDNSQPIIIISHGFSSHKNRQSYISIKDTLADMGISSFRFDFFGHGESEGIFENITITEAIDDVLQAIKYLKSLGYLRIGLMGSSFGGMASINAAAHTRDVILMALKSPVSDYAEVERKIHPPEVLKMWKKRGYLLYEDDGRKLKINYSFFDDFDTCLAYKHAPKILIPTLIVHGDADERVPVSQSIKIAHLIPNCKLVVIKGANHWYTDPTHQKEMIRTLTDFIQKYALKY